MESSTLPRKAAAAKLSSRASSELRLSSSRHNQVSLYDWWLIKADSPSGRTGLAVGGRTSKEQLGIRVFHSASVVKRLNTNLVETSDGFRITVTGSINKPRTIQNGFLSEVCNHFLFGFPYYWEEYASQSFVDELTNRADGSSSFLPKSIDDLPGALLRDFFDSNCEISRSCKRWKSIFEDILQTYSGDDLNAGGLSISPNKDNDLIMTRDPREDETQSSHKNHKVAQDRDGEYVPGVKPGRKKFQGITCERGSGFDTNNISRRARRRVSCLQMETIKHEENIAPRSSARSPRSKSVSGSEAPEKQGGGSLSGSNVSNPNLTTRKLTLRSRSIDFLVKSIS